MSRWGSGVLARVPCAEGSGRLGGTSTMEDRTYQTYTQIAPLRERCDPCHNPPRGLAFLDFGGALAGGLRVAQPHHVQEPAAYPYERSGAVRGDPQARRR